MSAYEASKPLENPEQHGSCISACSGLIKPKLVAEVVSQFLNFSPGSRHACNICLLRATVDGFRLAQDWWSLAVGR